MTLSLSCRCGAASPLMVATDAGPGPVALTALLPHPRVREGGHPDDKARGDRSLAAVAFTADRRDFCIGNHELLPRQDELESAEA